MDVRMHKSGRFTVLLPQAKAKHILCSVNGAIDAFYREYVSNRSRVRILVTHLFDIGIDIQSPRLL